MSYFTIFSRLIIRPLRKEPIRTIVDAARGRAGRRGRACDRAGRRRRRRFISILCRNTYRARRFRSYSGWRHSPAVLTRLAVLPYPLKLRPRIEDYAIVFASGKTVPFIGVDVLADASVPEETSRRPKQEDVKLSPRDSVWAGQTLGWRVGDHVRLL